MRGSRPAMNLETVSRQTLIDRPNLASNRETRIVPISHHDLHTGQGQRLESQIPQRQHRGRCRATALRALPNPVTEIAELVGGGELIQATAADELPIHGKDAELMRRTGCARGSALSEPAKRIVLGEVRPGPAHPTADGLGGFAHGRAHLQSIRVAIGTENEIPGSKHIFPLFNERKGGAHPAATGRRHRVPAGEK